MTIKPKTTFTEEDWLFTANICPAGFSGALPLVAVRSRRHNGKWLPAEISWGSGVTGESDAAAGVENVIAALQEAVVIATEFNRTHGVCSESEK